MNPNHIKYSKTRVKFCHFYPEKKQLLSWQGTVEFSEKESANNVKYQSNEQEPKQTMNKRRRQTVVQFWRKTLNIA